MVIEFLKCLRTHEFEVYDFVNSLESCILNSIFNEKLHLQLFLLLTLLDILWY